MGAEPPEDERDPTWEDGAVPVPESPPPDWPPASSWSELRAGGQHPPHEPRGAGDDAAARPWLPPESRPSQDMTDALRSRYALQSRYARRPAPPQPLRDVLATLSASGIALSREELLDALWLADRLPSDASAPLARATGLTPPLSPPDDLDAPITGPPPAEAVTDADPWGEGRASGSPTAAAQPPGYTPPTRRPPSGAVARGLPAPDARPAARGATPLHAGAVAPRVSPRASRALPVRTPGTTGLGAGQLQLGRALRPLKQSRPDPRRWELDEAASADSAAESGLADAVLRPGRARWLDLALLVDDGVSMLLWQRLAAETRQLLERSGAFRTVRVLGLDTRGAAAPLLGRAYSPGTAVLSPATVADPGGNTLVLVVSDGVGAAWRDGRMRTALKQWARCGPTAVLHALPEHLWDGSGLRAERWQVTTRRRGAPNLTWDVADPVLPPELASFDGIPVPVLAPEPDAVGAWATLVASPGTSAVLPLLAGPDPGATPALRARPSAGDAGTVGAVGDAGPTGGSGPTGAAGDAQGIAHPESAGRVEHTAHTEQTGWTGRTGQTEQTGHTESSNAAARAVLRFRAAASPQAYRLAAQLAALAPLSVPVMRLTQDALGAEVTTGHLAEVFLSGLMRRTADSGGLAPQHRTFDFTDAARGLLLTAAPAPDLVRTGRAVSRRLAELAGRSPDFPSWMAHPAGTEWADAGTRPFGWVDERLLRRLGVGGYRPPLSGGDGGARKAPRAPSAAAPWTSPDPEVPAYVDEPGSDWRSLTSGNPRRAGPWQLFARHLTARTTSGLFLGRFLGTGSVASVRLTRPGSVARGSLPRQVAALRSLNGRHAPLLTAVDPADEPAWFATGVIWDGDRPAPDLTRRTSASGHYDDPVAFARLGQQLAAALAGAHAAGIAHGDLAAARVLVADGEVFVTGWCVEEHPDGFAHDISQLASVLASVMGEGLPLAFHDLLRLCGSPLMHQRPSAADVADRFEEFARTHARGAVFGATIGHTASGAELVLDLDRMGPHGGLEGHGEDRIAVLDALVLGIAAHRSPADVQIVLVGDDPTRLLRRRTRSLPHVVLTCDAAGTARALGMELRRRQELADEARTTGTPLPAPSRLVVVLDRDHDEVSGLLPEGPQPELRVHIVSLMRHHTHDGADFVIDFTHGRLLPGPPCDGVLRHAGEATPFTVLPDPPLTPFSEPPPATTPVVDPTRQAQLVVEHRNAVAVGRAGRPEHALADLLRVAESQRLLLGPDHPETLDSTYELAILYTMSGRYDDALSLCADTAERRARALGPRDVHTLVAHQQCAFLLGRIGRHGESYSAYRAVLSSWNTTVGPYHPGTLLCRHNLAVALIMLGRHQEAAEEARAAYAGRALVHGPDHPDTLASGHELAVALRGAGRDAEACAVAVDVHLAREHVLGPQHPDTLATGGLLTPPKRPGG
ncbi:SAV_2336 N-terminal domain-related protein [Streptomyces flavofungini]|uniref:SAV_2336 N-terminal domain-related protein n=1 Tax=Streptomyces flavofungini TaxID=68200 RepID=UPI0025B03367|nr:SAV_2336 N-terminal domain-related protein [Streptomyces flavofungini]WJV45314.1 SAV_2336 N-terminal domain-related protein [Streptomyces flavofungini]